MSFIFIACNLIFYSVFLWYINSYFATLYVIGDFMLNIHLDPDIHYKTLFAILVSSALGFS